MQIGAANGPDLRALFHQRHLDFKTLRSAVEAGDTTAAQAALQSYQKDNQSISVAVGSDQPEGSDGLYTQNTQIRADMSKLTTAVEAGQATDAQTALKALEQDRGALRQEESSTTANAASAFGKDLTSLIASVQAGDQSGAQSSAEAVVKDLQSLFQSTDLGGVAHHHHHQDGAATAAQGPSGPTTDSSVSANDHDGDDGSGSPSVASGSQTDIQSSIAALVLKEFSDTLKQSEQTTSHVVL
jgi:ribosomal protein S20